VRPPGATTFRNWLPASTKDFAVFDAGSPVWSGRGEYGFRARYVETSTRAASGYSDVRSIEVT
jgi:hypothetical protein